MLKNKKISASQLFCLLLLSRLSVEIVFPRTSSAAAVEEISAVVISELLRFALALPLIVYSFNGDNVHAAVFRKNRFFGWLGALFASLLLVGASVRNLFYASVFTVKNLLIGSTMWIIFITSVVFAVYAAVMGVEAIARAGAVVLMAAAAITVAVMLADIPYMRPEAVININGVSSGGFDDFLNELVERFLRGGDYLIFAALLPYVEKKTKNSAGKCVLLFALFSTLFSVMICVVNCLVLREMYGLCEYPFIAAASLSDVAFFKRLDGAAASVWVLCIVFRSGAMLLAAGKAISDVYRAKSCKPAYENGGAV